MIARSDDAAGGGFGRQSERRISWEKGAIVNNLSAQYQAQYQAQFQGSTNRKLWQAVIDRAMAEWVGGPVRHKQKAEHFLFYDEDDFPFVCRSAGLDPEYVRESLWLIRAQAVAGKNTDAA